MLSAFGENLGGGRWFSAAADRNKTPILAILQRVLPLTGVVLEIGSGTGQHVAHFAQALPALTWQPSDPEAECRESIRAWLSDCEGVNVRPPTDLYVCRLPWPAAAADAVLSINMIHVAPWTATEALLDGANDVLVPRGLLFLYGPFRRYGGHTAASNAAFDARLRATDPQWGLRDLEAVVDRAAEIGFALAEVVDMPANNFSVVLRKVT